jgi:RNA polymerase sigma factor (TIGR02999 family)
MNDVTRILSAIEQGDPKAAHELLPLVYQELRRLAAQRLAHEAPGQTLQATALVHEAYLRLVGEEDSPRWENRGHFFAAAAEAMRRILVEKARRRRRRRHGGNRFRADLLDADLAIDTPPEDVLVVDEALSRLAAEDVQAAELVKLRYFAGLSVGGRAGPGYVTSRGLSPLDLRTSLGALRSPRRAGHSRKIIDSA